jgi:peptidoglycan/LPS O-acetylase OafA/YrhL
MALLYQWSLTTIFTSIIIVCYSQIDDIINKLKTKNQKLCIPFDIIRGIGIIAYSVYLWHCLFTQLSHKLHPSTSIYLWIGTAVMSMCVGYISWKYIECKFYKFV